MKWEILVIGRGGQGVLILGRVLGLAASLANLYSVVTETYEAETRGGQSRSDVIIASSMAEAEYIKVQSPDVAIFMYPFSVESYKSTFRPSTVILIDEEFVNPELFKDYKVISARFTEVAEKESGTRRAANMAILGKLIKETKIMSLEHVKMALKELIQPEWLEVNIKALEAGFNI